MFLYFPSEDHRKHFRQIVNDFILYYPFFLIITTGLFQVKASGRIHASDTLVANDTLLTVRLHEVKVVAQGTRLSGASSLIRQEVIQHIQSYSLSDLMQLLPGGTTKDISFKSPGQFTIRSIGSSELNALGTGISIDGVRISPNAGKAIRFTDVQDPIPVK